MGKKDKNRIVMGDAGYPAMHEMFVPKAIFFTNGVGVHKDRLSSFELALRDAGIEKANLVTVSSIFPPHCVEISRKEGEKLIKPGQIVHCVMARQDTNEPNRLIAASIGLARPADAKKYGYLSEHHSYGENANRRSSSRRASSRRATSCRARKVTPRGSGRPSWRSASSSSRSEPMPEVT